MKVLAKKGDIVKYKDDVIVIGVFEDEKLKDDAKKIDDKLNGLISSLIKKKEYKAELSELKLLYTLKKLNSERILLAGLGKRKEFTLDKARKVASMVSLGLRDLGVKSFTSLVFNSKFKYDKAAQAFVEGVILGHYQYTKYKTVDKDKIKNLRGFTLIEKGKKNFNEIKKGAKKGEIIANNVNFTRDLVNGPSNEITPTKLANVAREIVRKNRKVKCKVLDGKQIKKIGMNALYSVGKGSKEDPKFIVLEYNGGKNTVALIGKGITFDSGGIGIKAGQSMEEMKGDMAGGAAVLGVIKTIAELNLKLNVIGLVPAAENMPSGSAYKPGDIIKSYSKKTIEVLHTDAEGRMVLADALSYSLRYKPKVIVDIATLTGAVVIALGPHASGLMSNDDKLAKQIIKAGEESHERVWQLPLFDEYKEDMKSQIADVRNLGGWDHYSGVIRGAAFLSEFIGEAKWAHLDIAGTSFLGKKLFYNPVGSTGVGVRLIIQFLEDFK